MVLVGFGSAKKIIQVLFTLGKAIVSGSLPFPSWSAQEIFEITLIEPHAHRDSDLPSHNDHLNK